MKQNLHTHSMYDDGSKSINEIVEKAIEKGFDILGFSGHSCNSIDSAAMSPENSKRYYQDVLKAKEAYKDRIQIYLGIEQDSMSDPREDYDYRIGSVHYLNVDGIDYPIDMDEETFEKMLKAFGSAEKMADQYYREVSEMAKKDEIDIIGHLDLIGKYNEHEKYYGFSNPELLKKAREAIDIAIDNDKIFEINTGAMARGYRTKPYPQKELLDYIFQKDGKVMINTDCHNPEYLDYAMEEALELAREVGFQELWIKTPEGFKPIEIEEFYA